MTTEEEKLKCIKNSTKSYLNFPKQGINYRDIFSVLKDPELYSQLLSILINRAKCLCNLPPTIVAGIESRGFLFGPQLALEFNAKFIPIRRKGKLPGDVKRINYDFEYGQGSFEIQMEYIKPNDRILIVDDLLATSGTAMAAFKLFEELGAPASYAIFVYELVDLKGRQNLPKDIKIESLIELHEK